MPVEVFLTVSVVMLTVLAIVRTALRHAENIKRIEHGYPTLDRAGRERPGEGTAYIKEAEYTEEPRLQ
jgi:hypothetical protein